MKKKQSKEIIELELKKQDIEKLEDGLNSLRDYGFSTVDLGDKLLIFFCDELIDNYENFERFLLKSGLSPDEVSKHIKELNKDNSI